MARFHVVTDVKMGKSWRFPFTADEERETDEREASLPLPQPSDIELIRAEVAELRQMIEARPTRDG